MFTYLQLARHDWETALTCSFPFYFIQSPSCSAAYEIIDGDLGLLEYPIQVVVSNRPHLVYEASLQDLLEPTKEVVIAYIYRARNDNNVFRSRTLPHGAFE